MSRKFLLPSITVFTAVLFIGRLISLQLINSSYKLLSDDNAVIENEIFPERGYIYDRNKKLLVSNQPAYDLMAIPENVIQFDTIELAKMLNIEKSIIRKNLIAAKKFSTKLPYVIFNQISKEQNAIIQEKIWKFPGFYLQKKSLREYPNAIASNVLGYVSEVNKNDMKKDDYYSLGEQTGRQGIERYYEHLLRGVKGKRFLQKDRFNRIIGPYERGIFDIPSKGSKNLILTLDLELQKYGEQLLKNKEVVS